MGTAASVTGLSHFSKRLCHNHSNVAQMDRETVA